MIGWGLPRLTRGSFSKRSTSFRYWNYWPKFWTRPIILLAKSCSIFSNTKFFLMVFSDHISDLVHWGRKRLTNVILWKFVKTLISFTLTFWMNLTLASLRPQLVYIQTYCIWTLSKNFFFSLWLISSNWGKLFWNVLDQNLWSWSCPNLSKEDMVTRIISFILLRTTIKIVYSSAWCAGLHSLGLWHLFGSLVTFF